MKAIVIEHAGGPEALELKEVPTPKVKPGWTLVKVKGFGINRSEIFTRNGESPTVTFPRILGIECVGVIADTSDPDHLPVGQKVVSIMGGMGRAFDGGYAEYALLPNAQIYPVATNLSWPELAAVPETYYTAYGSLHNMHIQDADSVLIRAATSGVGVAATQLAKAIKPGIKVAGSTRSKAKFDLLKKVGCDEPVLDTNSELQTDDHFDAVLELVGTKTIKDSFKHLNPGGYLCLTGGLGNEWVIKDFDPFVLPMGASLTNFGSGFNVTKEKIADLLHLIESHHIDVQPSQIFDLAHTGDAQAALDRSDSFGKVVVLP
ncbi:alcohol dehydrogenase catalytic domain-containing protein [Secundilactobacillus folii]|uniref:Zinc-binding dehydrogenase n=1 Tax=Secundilactobacillus folii TaxID=2678357 RepID=A0A7X3C3L3_9LACO|nr:zinc-binding dehydrogenase [Secundilactobacillus folii]MTV82726.1 zinc-binding dehydrogenase [Secundilactobacillus folii]